MKLHIVFIIMLSVCLSIMTISHAATTTVTTTTVTKTVKATPAYKKQKAVKHTQHKHYKKHYPAPLYYYEPAYCVADSCACGGKVCYAPRYFQCHNDFYYQSGRNSARVDICY